MKRSNQKVYFKSVIVGDMKGNKWGSISAKFENVHRLAFFKAFSIYYNILHRYRIFSNCLYASAINQQNPFSEFKLIDKKLPPLHTLSPIFFI